MYINIADYNDEWSDYVRNMFYSLYPEPSPFELPSFAAKAGACSTRARRTLTRLALSVLDLHPYVCELTHVQSAEEDKNRLARLTPEELLAGAAAYT
jgi:hypothetical protein